VEVGRQVFIDPRHPRAERSPEPPAREKEKLKQSNFYLRYFNGNHCVSECDDSISSAGQLSYFFNQPLSYTFFLFKKTFSREKMVQKACSKIHA
jgi:hypothetical protein